MNAIRYLGDSKRTSVDTQRHLPPNQLVNDGSGLKNIQLGLKNYVGEGLLSKFGDENHKVKETTARNKRPRSRSRQTESTHSTDAGQRKTVESKRTKRSSSEKIQRKRSESGRTQREHSSRERKQRNLSSKGKVQIKPSNSGKAQRKSSSSRKIQRNASSSGKVQKNTSSKRKIQRKPSNSRKVQRKPSNSRKIQRKPSSIGRRRKRSSSERGRKSSTSKEQRPKRPKKTPGIDDATAEVAERNLHQNAENVLDVGEESIQTVEEVRESIQTVEEGQEDIEAAEDGEDFQSAEEDEVIQTAEEEASILHLRGNDHGVEKQSPGIGDQVSEVSEGYLRQNSSVNPDNTLKISEGSVQLMGKDQEYVEAAKEDENDVHAVEQDASILLPTRNDERAGQKTL